jgi:glutamate decarboxylase
MVFLASVRRDSFVAPLFVKRVDTIPLEAPKEHDFYSSIYGSRFATEDMPMYEMPEKEMPREVAYRMIKDDLSLDGNPKLKYV